MAGIERIVNVQINLDTLAIARRSFDKLLIVGVTTMAPRIVEVLSADELLAIAGGGINASSPIYRAAQVAFSQIPAPASIFVGRRGATEEPAVALAAIRAERDGWYGIVDATRDTSDDDVLDFATWAGANGRLFLAALTTAQVGTIGTALRTGNHFRAAWWHAPDPLTQFPDVAIAVKAFSRLPGGETWANQTLAGVAASPLTETEAQAVFAQNGNTFETFRDSISITQNGKVAAGEWIDVIRFRDWLVEEIKTNVFDLLTDNRVPYTDAGIAAVGQAVRAALDLGVSRGGIAPVELAADGKTLIPSYMLSLPRSATVSAANRAARRLTDVGFSARLAGAIHAAEVRGTLTYNLNA